MKKSIILTFFIIASHTATAQNAQVIQLQTKTESLVKEIGDKGQFSLQTYKDYMVAIELLRKAADTPELRMNAKNKELIKSVTRESYYTLLKEDYDAIITASRKENINWGKVKFVDLLVKPRALFKLGQPGYECLLIMEDTSKRAVLYTLQVDFIVLGTDVYMFEMDDFKAVLK